MAPATLTSLPFDVLVMILAQLKPADTLDLRFTCKYLHKLPMQFSLAQVPERQRAAYLYDQRLTAFHRFERDHACPVTEDTVETECIRVTKTKPVRYHSNRSGCTGIPASEHVHLQLLICNKCGKLKSACSPNGFNDSDSTLTERSIMYRECISCRVKRFENLQIDTNFVTTVAGERMFACWLCKLAKPLCGDGIESWLRLSDAELERMFVEDVALIEHKFCQTCFDNRASFYMKGCVNQELIVDQLEALFGRLDVSNITPLQSQQEETLKTAERAWKKEHIRETRMALLDKVVREKRNEAVEEQQKDLTELLADIDFEDAADSDDEFGGELFLDMDTGLDCSQAFGQGHITGDAKHEKEPMSTADMDAMMFG